jgi:hypothetical protein
MIIYGKSIDLAFVPDNKRLWLDFLEQNNGKKLVLEIEVDKKKRSLDQNAFYWLYLGVIEKESGNTASDLHELFKRKFLPPIPKKILGTEFRIPASTTTLNKTEFTEYLDKICALTNVPIPVIEKASGPSYPTESNETAF